MIFADIAAGLFFGILSGMGIGGAGLIVIYLTTFRQYSQLDAQAANLLFFTVSAAASMFIHFRKRKIDVPRVLFMALWGIGGSLLGAQVAALLPQEITKKLFGIMLIGSGITVLVRRGRRKVKKTYRIRFDRF